jgi:hypothetical protein
MNSLFKWQKAETLPRALKTTINFYYAKLYFRATASDDSIVDRVLDYMS